MKTQKTKQNKRNKGSIVTKNGKIYARLRFTGDFGKKRDIWRRATDVKDAMTGKLYFRQLTESKEIRVAYGSTTKFELTTNQVEMEVTEKTLSLPDS